MKEISNDMDMIFIVPKENVPLNNKDKVMLREINIENYEDKIKDLPTNFMKMRFFRENIGVSILKSYLDKYNFASEIIYLEEYSDTTSIVKNITSINPPVIGISVMYNLQLTNAIQTCLLLRKAKYNGHIIFGGACATLLHFELLTSVSAIDSIALGEGENTLRVLLERILANKKLDSIPGLSYRSNGKIISSNPVIINDLDDVPYANREYLKKYKSKLGNKMTVCSIYTSRGCAGKCTFCSAPNLADYNSIPWRARSVENLLSEMQMLTDTYGIRYFDIIDENFFGYGENAYKRLEELANGIIKKKLRINFRGEIRADANLNYDILAKLKNAGLTDVLIGIESGSQSVLNRWRKETKILKTKSVINLVQTMGFNFDPAFIMVDPITTVDEILESIDFIIDTKIYKCEKPLYLFNEMIIFPGTKIHEQFLKDDVIIKSEALPAISINSSQQDINNFCQKISFCDYIIKDKYVRSMWTTLKEKVNYLTDFVEIRMPLILSEFSKEFSTQDSSGKELIINKIQ